VKWLRLHLSSCVVSKATLKASTSDPENDLFRPEDFAMVCLEKLFCSVVGKRFQALINHLVKERSFILVPTTVDKAVPWIQAAFSFFFLHLSNLALVSSPFSGVSAVEHTAWLEAMLPPMEKPVLAGVTSDLDRIWRVACHDEVGDLGLQAAM
jgi:hypothetical protein